MQQVIAISEASNYYPTSTLNLALMIHRLRRILLLNYLTLKINVEVMYSFISAFSIIHEKSKKKSKLFCQMYFHVDIT